MPLVILLSLHHLADTIQPSWLIANKHKHAWAVYEHAFTWAGIVSFGLIYLGAFTVNKFLFLLIGHFLIDYFKYKLKSYNWIYLDQALHYLQIIAIL